MSIRKTSKSSINFKISLYSLEEKILRVDLYISNVGNRDSIDLYKNKLQWFDIKSNSSFNENGEFVHIENEYKEWLEIQYKVKLGIGGKHGYLGYIDENLITFSGEQVLIFPVELLTLDDNKLSGFVESICLEYNFNKNLKRIVPYEKLLYNGKDSYENKYSFCMNPKWDDVYEIMKSCYAFGIFKQIQYENKKGTLNVFLEDSIVEYYSKDILGEIESLYIYYESLFKTRSKNMNIIIFSYLENNREEIFGGSGREVIGATFDLVSNLRHWQLLSHRMFHSFMDSTIKSQEFHMTPNLWITEGLATYYENIALKNLSNNLKDKLGIIFYRDENNCETSMEFNKLFNRYLYFKLKDENKFSIIPMKEEKIKSCGQLEFLHYTQSPLIIKLLEDIIEKRIGQKDNIINYLINIRDNYNYSIKNMIYALLGQQVGNKFAQKFLFDKEILPLWYLKENDDIKKVINDLNEAEYIYWTWFRLEEFNYSKYELNYNDLEEYYSMDSENIVLFNDKYIDNSIKKFSCNLYKILEFIM